MQKVLEKESPLQIMGTLNAFTALLAKESGFQAIYLSGAGVANNAFGIEDVGETTLAQVEEETKRIASAVDLPFLVDIDTGWEDPEESVRRIEQAGASAVHIEDQIPKKLCGHLDGIQLISKEKMVARLQKAIQGKKDPNFFVIARTDARQIEGLEAAIERAKSYEAAGANAIFAEALTSLEEYQAFAEALSIPILANCTEFGKTPLFTLEEYAKTKVSMVLYPLTATRAMQKAAKDVMQKVREEGSQQNVLEDLLTREKLYQFLRGGAK